MGDIEDLVCAPKKGCKFVISLSRRTDIPAFFLDKYIQAFRSHQITYKNKKYSLAPDDVGAIVWWSKDYSNFINEYEANRDFWRQYAHNFQFTINSESELEPNVPPLEQRLQQLAYLCSEFTPQSVKVRFDPICIYTTNEGEQIDNLGDFECIVQAVANEDLRELRTSFCITYSKVRRRLAKNMIQIIELTDIEKKKILGELIEIAAQYNVQLVACADAKLNNMEPRFKRAPCIDGRKLLTTGRISIAIDAGQRAECMCTKSIDFGDYSPKCGHGCLYCYANPI